MPDTQTAAVYLGLDLGTSGLKGVAVSSTGSVMAQGSARYPTSRDASGGAEQEPGDWTAAALTVLDELGAATDPAAWRSIGLAGMIPTLVTAGDQTRPTGRAITWQDSRAETCGDALRERAGPDVAYQTTGQWLDGRYLLPMYLRIAAAEPGRAAATHRLLSAKDYLHWWLTGLAVTDPSTATGFGCYDLRAADWHPGIMAAAAALAGRDLPSLPAIRPSSSSQPMLAHLADQLGCGQVPVCLGAADSVLGAFGLGARQPGQIGYVAGTSNVIIGVTGQLTFDDKHRFLVTPMAEPGRWGLEMDLLATGDAIRWVTALVGAGSERDLVSAAAQVELDQAPIVLPYLSPGEQGALWDQRLHGTVVGLTLGHGPSHLARGLLTGIVLESRRCLGVLDEAGGFGQEVLLGGTSASHSSFRADLANATRCSVTVPSAHDAPYSAIGAARLAALSVDGRDLAQADDDLTQSVHDAAEAATWDSLWADYERARLALMPYYHDARH